MNAESGMTPPPIDLPKHMMSGIDVPVIDPPELSGPPHARLNLIGDQQRTVAGAQLARPRQVILRRHHRARFALHRFDHECGNRRAHGLRLRELMPRVHSASP